MRPVDWNLLRQDGILVLLTVEEVEPNVDVLMADFRDTHALFYAPLNAWMGMAPDGMHLGTAPPEMRDGIWYVVRDEELYVRCRNISPRTEHIQLRRLP